MNKQIGTMYTRGVFLRTAFFVEKTDTRSFINQILFMHAKTKTRDRELNRV